MLENMVQKNMAGVGWICGVGGTCPPCKTGCKQTCMNYGYGFNISFLFRWKNLNTQERILLLGLIVTLIDWVATNKFFYLLGQSLSLKCRVRWYLRLSSSRKLIPTSKFTFIWTVSTVELLVIHIRSSLVHWRTFSWPIYASLMYPQHTACILFSFLSCFQPND